MNNATFYLTRYSCPLFVVDTDNGTPKLVGTSVPFTVLGRQFLLTARHIVEWHNPENLCYPTDRKDQVGYCGDFIGTLLTSVAGPKGFDNIDLAIMELPPGSLSSSYMSVPRYMIASSITLKHVDVMTLIGYPITKNKHRPIRRHSTLKSLALVIPHAEEAYNALGLNPLTHFCARFKQKGMKDSDGRGFRPPAPNGLSGGPVWHITKVSKQTGTDEGVHLLGIISEYNVEHNVIWGPRVSYAFQVLAKTFPELEDGFNILKRHRTFDPEEVRYYRKATDST